MQSTTVITVAAAIAALGNLVINVIRFFRESEDGPGINTIAQAVFSRWRDLLILTLVLILAWCFRPERVWKEHPNVFLTKSAWDALNKGLFELAMEKAAECIAAYQGEANSKQHDLQSSGASLPLEGIVSDEEKDADLARGSLNDVATCYYIRGVAAEGMGNQSIAIDSYRSAKRYTYALTWDPSNNTFWSPATKAAAKLSLLDKPSGSVIHGDNQR